LITLTGGCVIAVSTKKGSGILFLRQPEEEEITMRKFKLLWIVAMCVFLPAGAFATEILFNGDFELVNTEDALQLIGWTHTPNVEGSLAHMATVPSSGNWMAVMAPNGVSNALLYQAVDTSGYTQATVSFDYTLDSWDPGLPSGADYLAFFAVGLGTTFLDVFSIDVPVGTQETRGWNTYSQTFYDLPGGNLFVGFGLANGGVLDLFTPIVPGTIGAITTAYLDNMSIDAAPVPEPSTFLLIGSGLLGICLMARRSARIKREKPAIESFQ
jgi:hypothetical protein